MVVQEDSIGRFFSNFPTAINTMLNTLDQCADKDLKRIVWRILQFVDLPGSEWERTILPAKKEIQIHPDSEYVQDILYTVGHYQMGNQAFIEFLIAQKSLNNQLRYRDRVYDMIVQLKLGEDFYDYGLEGIDIMAKAPADKIMRSEYSLEQILLSATTVGSIANLFCSITSNEWVTFRRTHYSGDDTFMLRLATRCKEIHNYDPLIVLAVLRFVRELGSKHLRDDMKEIDQFFLQAGTAAFAIRYFVHMPSSHLQWELGALLTESSFDFLLDYYEQGYIEVSFLQSLVSSAYYGGDKSTADNFNQIYLAATGAENFVLKSQERQREQEAYELQKRQNDQRYLQNRTSFEEGLKKYFKAHGKKSLDADDILLDSAEARRIRNDVDANVLSSFIVHQIQNKKPVTLSHCLMAVADQDYFDYFRMHELLNYSFSERSDEEPLRQLLKQLYDERILKANFVTAIKHRDETISISNWENLLSRVFGKFGFPAEPHVLIDMLCMDMEGIYNFKKDRFVSDRQPSLSEKILKCLTPLQQQKASEAVLQRLQNGIAVEQVLENHLALCRRLEIIEGRETILSLLLKKAIRPYHVFAVGEIYVELGGEWPDLVPVLKAFHHFDAHGYYQLIAKLKDDRPDVVVESLLRAIAASNLSLEWRMNYAQTLMDLGNVEGFYFFTECMQNKRSLPSGPPRGFHLEKIETNLLLQKLVPLIPMLSVRDKSNDHEGNKSILIDLLFAVAEKSEKDLLLVDAALQQQNQSILSTESMAPSINWYRERLFENFRDNGDKPLQLNEVGKVLAEIQ